MGLGSIEDLHHERSVTFHIGSAFFRPQSQWVRDLGVLAAAVYRHQRGHLRVLETMAASGVRSLRYGLEAGADRLWTNEANPDLAPLLAQNLQPLGDRLHLTHQDGLQTLAHCIAQGDFYDLVDVDAFGNPSPFIPFALGATRLGGLVYLTATDGRTLGGHDPAQALQRYGTYGRAHPSAQEQGLRILMGQLAQQATAQGWGLAPVFATFTGQTFRVMGRLLPKPIPLERLQGFLGYCHGCGHYQPIPWRKLGQAPCPDPCHIHPRPQPLTLTGPLWLGPLHHGPTLTAMAHQATAWGWDDCAQSIAPLLEEADLPPYHFTLGELGRRGRMDPPRRGDLLAALRGAGYQASGLHWNPQAFKTNASIAQCLALARPV